MKRDAVPQLAVKNSIKRDLVLKTWTNIRKLVHVTCVFSLTPLLPSHPPAWLHESKVLHSCLRTNQEMNQTLRLTHTDKLQLTCCSLSRPTVKHTNTYSVFSLQKSITRTPAAQQELRQQRPFLMRRADQTICSVQEGKVEYPPSPPDSLRSH